MNFSIFPAEVLFKNLYQLDPKYLRGRQNEGSRVDCCSHVNSQSPKEGGGAVEPHHIQFPFSFINDCGKESHIYCHCQAHVMAIITLAILVFTVWVKYDN